MSSTAYGFTVGGSGLIFGFVVALWAAYFVPLAVRRYDEASKSGTIEKFSHLTRVIKHRDVELTEEIIIEQVPGRGNDPLVIEPEIAPDIMPVRASTRLAARRRRRTLITLMALTAVVGAVITLGKLPLWALVAPLVLDVAWLVACRVQVRGELGLRRVRAPREKRSHSRILRRQTVSVAAEEEETIILSGQFEDLEPQRKHVMEQVPLEAGALDDQIVIAVPVGSTTGASLWDPLPVTLPTYVTKPRAGRTVRTIEFGAAGAWTSGHVEAKDVDFPERRAEQDDQHDQRRAVGD
ncbi:hypothetical protein BH09ACT10_BH09ACT10_27910 [soil metagenome]